MLIVPDFNRLKVFYYIFTSQSVAGAAQELGITQSAVSQQLKKLETELKTNLFTRQHKRLIPTSDAQKLFSILQPFFQDLSAGLRLMKQAKDHPSGDLRIGAPREFGQTYLPKVFASFHAAYPDVNFKLRFGDAKAMFTQLNQGDLDIALIDEYLVHRMRAEELKQFAIEKITDEEVILAGSREYCEARLGNDFSFTNLIRQNYISSHSGGVALKNWFKYHFSEMIPQLNIVLETESLQAAMTGIENHMGLSVTASHLIYDKVNQGLIVPIPTQKKPIINRISLAQLQDKKPSLTEKVFLAQMRQDVQKIGTLGHLSDMISNGL